MKNRLTVLFVVLIFAAFVVPSAFAQDVTPPADGGFDFVYISQLLQALILATLPVLVGSGVRWLVERGNLEKAKLTSEQQFALEVFVRTAVFAAEQMKLAGRINNKLDYATAQVQMWSDRHGFKFDISEIRAHIEAAVLTKLQGFEIIPPADTEAG